MGGMKLGREAQDGVHICTHMADSHCCMAETNTTLLTNYLLIKKMKTKK